MKYLFYNFIFFSSCMFIKFLLMYMIVEITPNIKYGVKGTVYSEFKE